MVAEGNVRFKTDNGWAEFGCHVCAGVSHNFTNCGDIFLQFNFVHYVLYCADYILQSSIYYLSICLHLSNVCHTICQFISNKLFIIYYYLFTIFYDLLILLPPFDPLH